MLTGIRPYSLQSGYKRQRNAVAGQQVSNKELSADKIAFGDKKSGFALGAICAGLTDYLVNTWSGIPNASQPDKLLGMGTMLIAILAFGVGSLMSFFNYGENRKNLIK